MPYILGIGEKLSDILKDSFHINIWELLINVVATILLIILIRYVFYDKVSSFLNKKKEKIEEEYRKTDEIKEEALRVKEEALSTLSTSKEEARAILSEAEKDASLIKESIIKDAEKKASSIITEARKEGEIIKSQKIEEARSEIIDIASSIAGSIIDKEIDSDKYNEKLLSEIGNKDE